jgi:hypothetical protein
MIHLPIISSGSAIPLSDQTWTERIPASMKRRDPRIWQMAFSAAKQAVDRAGILPKSIICGTALGALDETVNYLDGVFKDGFGSPRHFIASVHNSMAGRIALELKINGPNITVCDGQNSFASAIVSAGLLNDESYPVLILAVDEKTLLLQKLIPHLSPACKSFLNSEFAEAAIAFMAGKPSTLKNPPCISAVAPRPVNGDNQAYFVKELIAQGSASSAEIAPFPESSDSFISPALCAFTRFESKTKGEFAIGSYSPSADAAAVTILNL